MSSISEQRLRCYLLFAFAWSFCSLAFCCLSYFFSKELTGLFVVFYALYSFQGALSCDSPITISLSVPFVNTLFFFFSKKFSGLFSATTCGSAAGFHTQSDSGILSEICPAALFRGLLQFAYFLSVCIPFRVRLKTACVIYHFIFEIAILFFSIPKIYYLFFDHPYPARPVQNKLPSFRLQSRQRFAIILQRGFYGTTNDKI